MQRKKSDRESLISMGRDLANVPPLRGGKRSFFASARQLYLGHGAFSSGARNAPSKELEGQHRSNATEKALRHPAFDRKSPNARRRG